MRLTTLAMIGLLSSLTLGGCFCATEEPDPGDGGAGTCGDGVVDTGEACDDGNTDAGDGCSDTCQNEGTPTCGDGILQTGEECDDGTANSDTVSGACRTNCLLPSCGDGVTDTGEACDDGAANDDTTADACRTTCEAAGCGDLVVDTGEQCDDGNTVPADGCDATCQNEGAPRCGDGILQSGEQCDDGAANDDTVADACRTSCQAAGCGDGVVDTGDACDDGAANSDVLQGACRSTCVAAGCGDTVTDYVIGESCDDGNTLAGDGCSDTCTQEATATCGDGNLDLIDGEQCDDGNTAAGDGCSPTCRYEVVGQTCGDGTVDPNEACDNGSIGNGDLCTMSTTPRCICNPPCDCNFTCNLGTTTTLVAGSPGNPGLRDGDGLSTALLGGNLVLAATDTHLYFSDPQNGVVRRYAVGSGLVETIAGSTQGYLDDAVGLNARFQFIEGVATDGLTLWVGDAGNHVIRAIDLTDTNFPVTTVAGVQGTGPGTYSDNADPMLAGMTGIRGLTYHAGLVYFLDPAGTLRSFDPAGAGGTGVITLAGAYQQQSRLDGFGTAARMVSPRYMASDGSGTLYIADTNGNQIRSYNVVSTWTGTFVGSGNAGYLDGVGIAAEVHRPRGMTSDGTSIYWVEFDAHTIRQADLATGTVTTLIGTPNGLSCGNGGGGYAEGTGNAAQISCPFSVAFHFPSRSLFFTDGGNSVLRQIQ